MTNTSPAGAAHGDHGRNVWTRAARSLASSATAEPASPSSRVSRRCRTTARELPDVHGIVGDVSRKDDIHPIAIQALGVLGGLDVLVNNASSLGPVPLVPLADTECEDLELALATNVRRAVSPDQGAAGIARRLRAGRSSPAGGERVERCRRQRLPELGRLRREQGGAPSSEPNLERGAHRRRDPRPVRRPG